MPGGAEASLRPAALRLTALVLGFAGGSAALHLSGWSGPERLQALVESAGWAGAVVFVVGYAVLVLVPSPASVLTILSGVLFGLWWGTLLAWAGALLGAFGGFLLGRRLGRPAVDRMLRGRLQDADQVLARHGLVAVLAVRLVPLFPFTPINYASGLLGVRLRDYLLGTSVGHRARRPRVRRCRRLGGRPARHRRRRRRPAGAHPPRRRRGTAAAGDEHPPLTRFRLMTGHLRGPT